MILFKKVTDLRKYLDSQVTVKGKVGFVPTMGALHDGHLSLIKRSKDENALTVCSIFVNPKQFNDPEDFAQYPVTPENDILLLESAQCDVLFMPAVDEVYPAGYEFSQNYDLGNLERVLEGKYRPGHFRGVCRVVHRLLDIVDPDILYLGQKDYQQCLVISRLLQLTDKEEKIKLKICPIIREPDGLAMSSRNVRLDSRERKKAGLLYHVLSDIRKNISPGNSEPVLIEAITLLSKEGFTVDYLEMADAGTLSPVSNWDGRQKIIALVAAGLGKVRLIDNMLIN